MSDVKPLDIRPVLETVESARELLIKGAAAPPDEVTGHALQAVAYLAEAVNQLAFSVRTKLYDDALAAKGGACPPTTDD